MSDLIHDSPAYNAHAEVLERLRHATLGRYDLYGELGRGGMAVVYLALDLALNRKVAIKAILPEVASHSGAIERFRREVQTSAALSHPHIIPIYAVGDESTLAYFAMKYVDGRGLDAVLREDGPQSSDFVHAILQQIGQALDYAHRSGVVHRDVKAANIMLDDGGWALLTDFGIAKATDSPGLTSSGMIVGTPSYMAPEQFSGDHVGPAADQYALGCVAFELLAGERPMVGSTLAELMRCHLLDPPPSLTARVPSCPPELDACIQRMLAKRPEDRFPTIQDAIASLQPPSKDAQVLVSTTISRLARSGAERRPVISQPVSPSPNRAIPTARSSAVAADALPTDTSRGRLWYGLAAAAAAVLIAVMATALLLKDDESASLLANTATEPIPAQVESLGPKPARPETPRETRTSPMVPGDRARPVTTTREPVTQAEGRVPTPATAAEQIAARDSMAQASESALTVEPAAAESVPPAMDASTPGALRIGTRLSGGFLYIDDEIIALPTAKLQRIPLSPGRHRLRITSNGCVTPWERVVDVRPGEVLTFNYITPQCDPRS